MMNTSGIPATRWFDAAMLPKDQVEQKDNIKAMMVFGHSPNTFVRIPVAAKESRSSICWWCAIRIRPTGRCSAIARTAPICCRPARQYESPGHAYGFEWIAPIVPADRQAALRIEDRRQLFCTCWQEARFRRSDVQEHQGREWRAHRRRRSERDQPRRLVDRLHGPVAGTPESASEEPGKVRPRDAARAQGRSGGRRRLLRTAVAVLGHARNCVIRARRCSTTQICM